MMRQGSRWIDGWRCCGGRGDGAMKEKDACACPGGIRGYDAVPDGSGEVQWPLEVTGTGLSV
jgi:hypothetical protein